MKFIRWLIFPHFAPVSVAAVAIILFVLGWFHIWWLAALSFGALFVVEFRSARDRLDYF